MSSTTTTWQIPYATSADSLCDGYSIVDSMAERIDALLGAFNDDLDRVLVIPYASISTTTPQSFNTNITVAATPNVVINYDTVNADTNSYTNLATLPSLITLPVTGANGGFFAVILNALAFTGNTVNTAYVNPYIGVNSTVSGDPAGANWADDVNVPMGGTLPKMISTNPIDGPIQTFSEVQAVNSGTPSATVTAATFFFFWVADK